jgi:branched-chain amino acid aminotransferase
MPSNTHKRQAVLFTPSLDGQILPGVTRNSILQLVRGHADGTRLVHGLPNNLTVEERSFTLSDVKEWASNDELLEAFGSGTAAGKEFTAVGWMD